MIRALKIFEIDPNLNFVEEEGELITQVKPAVDNFFREHIINSLTNKHSKPCRFRNETRGVVEDCRECFSLDSFNIASKQIAEELSQKIHYSVNDNFIFIVVWYFFEGANEYFEDNENILAILKMETNDGVQLINNSTFDIKENMLPDLGNQLQKCSFVYKSYLDKYEENNQDDKFHLKILDKQDKSIATYFINLMDSVVVADDTEMSKLAVAFIKNNVKKYTSESDKKFVDEKLRIMMSRREHTSVNQMVLNLQEYIQMDMLNKAGIQTITALSDNIFDKILKRNPSAVNEFKIEPVTGEKFFLRSNDRSIMISIEQGLIDDDTVDIEADEDNHYVTIPKELVDVSE